MFPKGTIVQLGLGGDFTLAINALITREIRLLESFRFHDEFAEAVASLGRGHIDVRALVTAEVPFEQAVEAFELANQRDRSMKVQLASRR